MSLGLARTSLLNGAAVATRLVAGLALNKVLAVYIGPAGFGVIGQFQSLVAMLGALAGGAFGNGVTKLTAERSADPARQLAVWRTAATFGLMGTARWWRWRWVRRWPAWPASCLSGAYGRAAGANCRAPSIALPRGRWAASR